MRPFAALLCLLAGCDGASGGPADLAIPPTPDGGPIDVDGGASGDLAVTPRVPFVYVSGYSPQIARYRLGAGGTLGAASTTTLTGTPSFLAIDAARRHLYAVDEATAGRVESFTIDPATGALTHLADISSGGNGPAHVSIDQTGAWVFAANYGDGTVSVFPVGTDGTLGTATDKQTAGANAHQIVASASNKFVFVPCKGADYIAQFAFDAQQGKLTPNSTPHVMTAAGSGPRHLAFHPSLGYAYSIQETDSTMAVYSFDAQLGRLATAQILTTRAAGAAGTNTGSAVVVHPSGNFLYGSNRGDDDIVRYALDGAGRMTQVDNTPSGGKTPRDFTIDPSGRFLLVANQDSSSVVVFSIDQMTGALTQVGPATSAPSPSFVGVVLLPGQ